MAAIFHEKIRENNYNSSNIRPMWMQISIYESYWWHKYLGETDKSPINNAELQRIVLGTLDMFVVIIRPMWMQISIYESYWWQKYLGKTDNNAEL